ncbi:MAG: hypothetical protein EOO17_00825 [Chloroflexi bacterium]|nr:MAG: hypothetical protein EOO17_00825 [Chloroflexota bacterium]
MTPPPVVAPAPVVSGGCESFLPLVSKYDWDVKIMMAIMQAESTCRSDAIGDTQPIAGLLAHSCGLFQIRTLAGRPTCEQLKDPATNIDWAYRIYKGQGLRAWSVFSNGKYTRYL